ncbi:N-methyl-L-tryptophan oxidase [Nesterenkonia halophila]
MHQTDFVVIGAGLAGAATAWRLAAQDHDVTVLERGTPADERGSSHGSARIFRYAYPDALYTDLVVQSRTGWDELEEIAGEQLIRPCGAVDHGAMRGPQRLAGFLEQAGVEHELLSVEAAHDRWPMFSFESEVLWHPDAGVIDAERSVRAMLSQAIDQGAALFTDWPVARIERSGAGYRLTSAEGAVVEAGGVIVCAGGWLPGLLERLPLPSGFLPSFPALEVRQEQAYHFPYRSDVARPEDWPTFIHKSATIQSYGLPGGRDAGFTGQKLAEFNGGKVIPSAEDQDGAMDEANRRRVVDFVQRTLPGLDPEPYAETTCLFTNAPDEDFILDSVDGLTVVSPCSGHGAKFAPLIGELAAGLATGTRDVPDVFRAFPR